MKSSSRLFWFVQLSVLGAAGVSLFQSDWTEAIAWSCLAVERFDYRKLQTDAGVLVSYIRKQEWLDR